MSGVLLSEQVIRQSFPKSGLFRDEVPWLLSPEPLALSKRQMKALRNLGNVLGAFYDACNDLYHASAEGKLEPWIADLLDAGKPGWLVDAQRSKKIKRTTPSVIRPDLILTEDLWTVTELDSVPGGQGVTAFLSGLYADNGWNIVGGPDGIVEGFGNAHPEGADIIVSRESSDYWAEMNFLASELGDGFTCSHAETYQIDIQSKRAAYRFFELFDTDNIPGAKELIQKAAEGVLRLSPPPAYHLEEKLWLALLHVPGLQPVWKKYLRGTYIDQLKQIIPHSWLVDPEPLPPQAALPWLNVNSWEEVAAFSQKERQLVLKISGFNEKAWGARGVYMGHDMSSSEWAEILSNALSQYASSPWLMQEFHAGMIVEHPYYDRSTGEMKVMKGRVRLCPYYYRLPGGKAELGGCLATIVPREKKKIHGMSDGIMVPCSF